MKSKWPTASDHVIVHFTHTTLLKRTERKGRKKRKRKEKKREHE